MKKENYVMEKIRCGIAGVVGRGQIYVDPMLACDFAEITAICDLKEDGLKQYAEKIGGNVKCFTNYEEMIDSGLLDVVVIATPIPCHVPQSIYALERDINVVCEVAAAETVEECKKLYKAVKKSKAQYMMAENCNFYKLFIILDGIIKAGLLGEVHYAEGQYLHCLGLPKKDEWRSETLWGANYCTHNLGPMLQWFDNERITKICCVGSGRHAKFADADGEVKREKANILLCRTESGRLMQVRLDFDTPTPYMLPFEVSGEKGRAIIRTTAPVEESYIHLTSSDFDHTHFAEEWKSLQYFEREFLTESWNEVCEKIPNTGHARADCVMVWDILKALRDGRKLPIDIDMAMNMTLPGILSKESIERGGEWIDIPNLDED